MLARLARSVTISGLLLLVVGGSLLVHTLTVSPMSSPRKNTYTSMPAASSIRFGMVSEDGIVISNLFSSSRPGPTAAEDQAGGRTPVGSCKPNIWTRLTSLFTLQTVQAHHCGTGGSCAGAYITLDDRECLYQCSLHLYEFHRVDPGAAGPCDGWKYNTGHECGECRCQEENCLSC